MNRSARKALHGVLVIAVALLLQVVPAAVHAAAAQNLSGVWQGKLAVDASNSLTVQFTFSKDSNGAYTAVLNSPDNPTIKNAATSGVSWDGTNLKLTVPSLSGSFAGTLKDGKVAGQWTQPGANLPLVLAPYQKPVVTAAAARSIAGSWTGVLTVGPVTQNLAFQFKQGAGGALEGTFGIPDQGVNGVHATNVVFENGELSLKVQIGPQLLDYKGKLAGDQITGFLKATGLPPDGVAVNLKRGEYKVVAPPLKLSAEAFAAVKGKWQGAMEVPLPAQAAAAASAPKSVKVNITVRFETNDKKEYIGYLLVTEPGQANAGNTPGFPISEAQFVDGKLTLKAPAAAIDYSGTVSGNTIAGRWVQTVLGRDIALTLTRQ
jgi:hypothetical protein